MGKLFTNRVSSTLFLLLLPILLSGCAKGFFGGEKGLFPGGGGGETVAADTTKISAKDLPATALNRETCAPFPASPIKDTILSQLINLQNPEDLMPISSPKQPGSTRSNKGTGVSKSEKENRSADFSYHDAVLTEDTVWHGTVVVEDAVTVAAQTTLVVESGTVVKFRGTAEANGKSSLMVLGRLVVKGADHSPVIFSTMNPDLSDGDWLGIVLTGSGKKNLIENCRVEGAVTGIDASFSTVTMKNVVFTKCRSGARLQNTLTVIDGLKAGECGAGLILYDCEADVRDANFFGNRLGLFASRTSLSLAQTRLCGNNLSALVAQKCRIDINNNSFSANGNGLTLVECEGSLSANRVARNASYGVVLKGSRVKINGNDIEENAKVGLRTEDGQGVAWGNALFDNGEYDLYNGGTEEFRAIGNWWGDSPTTSIASRIYDRSVDGSRGRVLFFPPLQKRPNNVSQP